MTFSTAAGRFRIFALAEAISWAGLLLGMFFKYVVVQNEIGVKIFGPIHGLIFVGFVLVTLMAKDPLKWDVRTLVLGLVSSIPPFGTVIFERWATKTGRLNETSAAPGAEQL
jgi:integral membrane protein